MKQKGIQEQARMQPVGVEGNNKGLAQGAVGVLGLVVIGVSTIAPAYTLTAAIGPTVAVAGTFLPAILISGFIPMLLVALGYKELNDRYPDAGTTFTWATLAFGPWVGWMSGWGLIAATVIVLSNLAAVATDFLYIMLSQLFNNPAIAELTDNLWVNIPTTLVFIAFAIWVSYRGADTTMKVQYALVAFQIIVLVWFSIAGIMHYKNGTAYDPLTPELQWFNPLAVPEFGMFAAGVSLSIFIFWGWDVTLTMNEETKDPAKTPGRGATLSVFIIMSLYLLISLAVLMFAGIGTTGLGAGNPENQESIFAVLATPIMGSFALLMSIAILTSSMSSLQSTMIGPARTLLSMGHYGALSKKYTHISPKYFSPTYATVVSGAAAAIFYVVTRILSENALWDTITALGMMVCFYYGITAIACVWLFRKESFTSFRNFLFKFFSPLIGGVVLIIMFVQTLIDSTDPGYGSGSNINGIGLVFILGTAIFLLGAVAMLIQYLRSPDFFKGKTLTFEKVEESILHTKN